MSAALIFVEVLAGLVGGTIAVIRFGVCWARDGRVPRSTLQGAAKHHRETEADPDRLLRALRKNTPARHPPLREK